MPTRTVPSVDPGSRTHSCSAVYFRSSGYTRLLLGWCWSWSWSWCWSWGCSLILADGRVAGLLVRLGELGRGRADGRGDLDGPALVDVHGAADLLHVLDEAAVERQRRRER